MCVQSPRIYTHADAWEMRTHARQLSMGSSCHIRKPCQEARHACNILAYTLTRMRVVDAYICAAAEHGLKLPY
jgi:hypothetical protein